ncbi:MAG TPA: hypothetical protein VK254_02480 [Candidatus Bathyarchaeia archaeon]|nr:hypothetical protein [Candidatus Bathyarchaeia archaeon]
MKNLTLFLFCIFIVFLQLSVEGVFFSERRIPDLALTLVITLVLTLGFKESVKWILLTGILIDAGSSAVFGTATLSFFLIGWTISWFADVADIRSRKTFFLATFALLVAVSEIVKNFIVWGGLKTNASYSHKPLNAALHIFSADHFLKILYTIVAAYILYYIFRRVSRALFVEPIKLMKRYH